MSPRSAEMIEQAMRRLQGARAGISVDPGGAISLAYYSMLNAARAALSEHDTYAKTHKGTWILLREEFVAPGLLDAELVTQVERVQKEREETDYNAWLPSTEEAQRVLDLADRFLTEVLKVIDPPVG